MAKISKNKKLFSSLLSKMTPFVKTKEASEILTSLSSGKNAYMRVDRLESSSFDMSWIKNIEDCIFDLGDIISNPRESTKTVANLVPVELAKKTNSESVQHLASHTQYIKEVTAKGDVIPNKILNIANEEDLHTYENRFIATLVRRLVLFIEKRYEYIKKFAPLHDEQVLYFKNSSIVDGAEVEIETKIKVRSESETKIAEISNKYVSRIEEIRRYVLYFYNSPFMKTMHTDKNVRSPIIMTNILRKNPKYHHCYELYRFIEKYDRLGVSYKVDENVSEFSEKELKEINEVLLTNYLALKGKDQSKKLLKQTSKVYKPRILSSIDDEEFIYGNLLKGPIEFVRMDQGYQEYLDSKLKQDIPEHPTKLEKEYYKEELQEKKENKEEKAQKEKLSKRKAKAAQDYEKVVQKVISQREKEEEERRQREAELARQEEERRINEYRKKLVEEAKTHNEDLETEFERIDKEKAQKEAELEEIEKQRAREELERIAKEQAIIEAEKQAEEQAEQARKQAMSDEFQGSLPEPGEEPNADEELLQKESIADLIEVEPEPEEEAPLEEEDQAEQAEVEEPVEEEQIPEQVEEPQKEEPVQEESTEEAEETQEPKPEPQEEATSEPVEEAPVEEPQVEEVIKEQESAPEVVDEQPTIEEEESSIDEPIIEETPNVEEKTEEPEVIEEMPQEEPAEEPVEEAPIEEETPIEEPVIEEEVPEEEPQVEEIEEPAPVQEEPIEEVEEVLEEQVEPQEEIVPEPEEKPIEQVKEEPTPTIVSWAPPVIEEPKEEVPQNEETEPEEVKKEKIPGKFIVKTSNGYYVSPDKYSVYKNDAYIFDDFNEANEIKKNMGGKVVKL